MAENTSDITPAGVAYYPESASIDKLTLITASGKEIDLKKIIIEFNYYEDLYSFSVSGSVTVRDAQGLIERFQISGGEFLKVDFGRVKNSKVNTTRSFRVYKLGDRKPAENLNSEFFTLHFCSEELLLSEQTKISKSYSFQGAGQEIYKTVTSILKDELKVKKKLNIEQTNGLYNFIVPRIKPFEAISWLSTYARPLRKQTAGADMLFFENKDGFNFRSIRTMLEQKPYRTYNYQQNNTDSTLEQKTTSVLQYEFVKSYDVLNEINSGTFANRLISVDPATRSFKITDFDYEKYKKDSKPANGNGVLNGYVNRLGKTDNTSYESVVKVVIGNSEQYKVPYIGEKPGAFANDIFIENFVPNRTAQIALANYTLVKIVVPGDPNLTVGMTVNFNIYSLAMDGENKRLDTYYSGKYLVNAVRHIIQSQGVYQTVMELAKESYESSLQPVNQTPSLKEAINE